jgi:hypothetical protein
VSGGNIWNASSESERRIPAPIGNAACTGRESHRDRSGIDAILQDERKHDSQQDEEKKPPFHGSSVTPALVKSIPD